MNVIVTGDRGYIGSVLVPLLLKRKHRVIGFDSGFFDNTSKINTGYNRIKKDVRKIVPSDLQGIDAIIHLSALSNDPLGKINPKLTQEINHKATVRLAKLAKKAGVRRFIFSSSCSIYGIAKSGVVSERSKVNPLTEYAKSKIETEKELKKIADENFFVGLLRNSTVYGYSPSFRNDLVVNNLVTCAIATNEIRILSDGSPWRPLVDVRDLAKIFIEFLETKNLKINGKVINVGFNQNNFQVKELVSAVKKYLPNCSITYTGEHGADTRSYKVNFNLFKKYFPSVKQEWNLEKSVKDLIKNLKNDKYSKKDFDTGKHTRLARLTNLLENKKINKEMYWTT